MPSRRQMIMGVVGPAAGAALAGCTSAAGANSKTRWAQPGSSLAPGGVPVTVPVDVTFTPQPPDPLRRLRNRAAGRGHEPQRRDLDHDEVEAAPAHVEQRGDATLVEER